MLVKIELGGGRQRAVPIPSYKNAEYFFFFFRVFRVQWGF